MKKLIIVDDEQMILTVMGLTLEEYGDEIITFLSAAEALAFIKTKIEVKELSPDTCLVVSDLKMPEVDGMEFLEEFRKISNAPFIFYSGHAMAEEIEFAMKLGATAFFVKPSLRELEEYISSLISN